MAPTRECFFPAEVIIGRRRPVLVGRSKRVAGLEGIKWVLLAIICLRRSVVKGLQLIRKFALTVPRHDTTYQEWHHRVLIITIHHHLISKEGVLAWGNIVTLKIVNL